MSREAQFKKEDTHQLLIQTLAMINCRMLESFLQVLGKCVIPANPEQITYSSDNHPKIITKKEVNLNRKRILWFTGILLVWSLLLAACSPETPDSTSTSAPTEEYQVNLPAVNNPQAETPTYPAPESQSDVGDQAYPEPPAQPEPVVAAEEAYPIPEEAVDKPAPRTELEATDPATVSLASGQIQLVEFFAFLHRQFESAFTPE